MLRLILLAWFASAGMPLLLAERPDCRLVYFPLPAEAGDAAKSKTLWQQANSEIAAGDPAAAFHSLWQCHHADPGNLLARRALGLPPAKASQVVTRRGRSAPPILRWRPGSYQQVETAHFTIFSTADPEAIASVGEQLERFYWVWAQVFFPLWEGRTDVGRGLRGDGAIGRGNQRMQVVLFKDAADYIRTLKPHVPGIERSTGFYSDPQRCTFLFAGEEADPATWQHELTHQLLSEATRSRLKPDQLPGEASQFWLIEGIATYMESVRFGKTQGWVGGWESPRLQFARYRWLSAGDSMPLAELIPAGRIAAQQREDLARWYAHAAAYTHLLMDDQNHRYQQALFAQLTKEYAIPRLAEEPPIVSPPMDLQAITKQMIPFLRLDDQRLFPPATDVSLKAICLGRTRVTAAGLTALPPQPDLQWLDLSGLAVDTADVTRLVPTPGSLDQLNLERTAIDDSLAEWLHQASRLSELDLSLTKIGDPALAELAAEAPLETVWLTGTQVTAETVKRLLHFKTLEQIDVQGTQVSDSEIEQQRTENPDVDFNPLQLIAQ